MVIVIVPLNEDEDEKQAIHMICQSYMLVGVGMGRCGCTVVDLSIDVYYCR